MVKLGIYFFGFLFFLFFTIYVVLSYLWLSEKKRIRSGRATRCRGGPGDPLFPGVFSLLGVSLHLGSTMTVLLARSRARLRALCCWSFLLRRSFWTLLWQKNFSNVLCVWESSGCAVDLAEEASNSTSTPATSFSLSLSLSLTRTHAHKSLCPDLKNTVDPFVD